MAIQFLGDPNAAIVGKRPGDLGDPKVLQPNTIGDPIRHNFSNSSAPFTMGNLTTTNPTGLPALWESPTWASASNGDLESLLMEVIRRNQDYLKADRATRDSLIGNLGSMQNPFSGSALQQALALQSGAIQSGFNTARERTMQSLAQRGALGTAQETSALRRLELDRARALSGAEASIRTDYAARSGDFDQRRYGLQGSLLGMMGGGDDSGSLLALLNRQDNKDYRDSQNQATLWNNIGRLAPLLLTLL